MLLPKKSEYKICAQCQDTGLHDDIGNLCTVCEIASTAICLNCGYRWAHHNGKQCLDKNHIKTGTTYKPDLDTVKAYKPNCYACNDEGYFKTAFGVEKKAKSKKEAKGLPVIELVDSKVTEPSYFGKGFIIDNTQEALEEKVKKKGVDLDIVVAKKNELMIDYDQEEIPEQFQKMLPILRQRFNKGTIFWKKQHSASGKHWHVIVTLPEEISDQERIVWQAVFGSDYMREGLSLLRVVAGMENPTSLFMPKDVAPVEIGQIEERPARKFKDA